jgi:hypothetical protein
MKRCALRAFAVGLSAFARRQHGGDFMKPKLFTISIGAMLMIAMNGACAMAQLALTADGISRGFHLSTFASNFPNADNGFGTAGAFGDLFTNSGLLVSDGTDGSIRLFKHDCDGQDASKVAPTAFYAVGLGGPTGMTKAHLHGKPRYYMATGASEVFEINSNGTEVQKIVTIPGDFNLAAVAGDPHFGVLLVTAPFCNNSFGNGCLGGVFAVDPVAHTSNEFISNFIVTGLQVDNGDNIFLTFTFFGTLWFNPDFSLNSQFLLSEIEGSVLGTGTLRNHIFLFNAAGELWEQRLDGSDLTMIASGGLFTPLASADPHNGSLVFPQSDRVVRLSGGGLASDDGETAVNNCQQM